MRLSMYILAEWLKKYEPRVSIQNGSRQIRNVRPFSEDHPALSSNVYVSALSADTFTGVMCMNQNDFIFISGAEPDDIINEILDAFDFYNSWSDRLHTNLDSCSLQEILDWSREVIPQTLIIADASYYVLAQAGLDADKLKNEELMRVADKNIISMEVIMQIEKNPLIRVNSRHSYLQDESFLMIPTLTRNLFVSGEHIGWLLEISDTISRAEYDLIDELGDIIEEWSARNAEQDRFLNVNTTFAELLKGTTADKNQLLNKLQFAGISDDIPKRVYYTDLNSVMSNYAILHRMNESSPHVYNLIFEERLVSIFCGDASLRQDFEETLRAFLKKTGGFCGSSPEFTDVFLLPEMYHLSQAACTEGKKKGQLLTCLTEVAVPYAMTILRQTAGSWIAHPAVGQLQAYDQETGMELCETLYVYLQCERNIARTARSLYIHRNSLLYRLKRIQEITEADLDNVETRLQILLTMEMLTKDESEVSQRDVLESEGRSF